MDAMTSTWTPEQLQKIGASDELDIAVHRADGSLRRWVPIWVVRVDENVYVRTWYRRADGWFGHAIESVGARIRVPDVQADVTIADVGSDSPDPRADVDDAYRRKYGHFGEATVGRMVADSAAETTLWLQPQ
jgi:hypothetical protein